MLIKIYMKIMVKIAAIWLILAGSFACEKEDNIDMSNIDFSNIENLYAQPLSVIQECVQGEWIWMTYYIGVAGGWIPMNNGVVEITKNKIISYKGVQEFFWKKQEIEWSMGNIQTHVMWDKQENTPICFFECITNDTLKVSGFMFHTDNHEFIKIKND
jgi:hypothetical protein